jgi:cephalosporin hydroxylase
MNDEIVNEFHRQYYTSNSTWEDTYWLGVRVLKCPLDLWIYQEILVELRPDLIIESGTLHGGSALYFASICDLIGTGEVVTIDVELYPDRPVHPRITYIQGSSVAHGTAERIREYAKSKQTVLVVLDSDHTLEHVHLELEIYSEYVTPGSYIIVEDTNINGHPVYDDFGPGPMEAVDRFLIAHPEFTIDRAREKFLVSFNPRGYLLKATGTLAEM